MKFVDEVRIRVKAGDGGNGCVAFRREKYVPFGGPAGGDGGTGGSVIFEGDEGKTSLLDLAGQGWLRAKSGEPGRGKDQYGRKGDDFIVRVPVGTIVWNEETGEKIGDVTEHGMHVVVAQGGKGGRGNIHFATPFDRAPRRAEPGTDGEEKHLRLELKVLADVGLLGFPNVGKSTLVASMSRARPKIADYPFTTLRPHLGVVKIGGRSSSATFVVADIPGLIPGASEGHGLGTRFLKHVERCRALLHLVAPPTDELREEGRDPLRDYDVINAELARFAPELAARPQIVAMSKGDLPETREAFEQVKKAFAKRKVPIRLISAATGEGLEQLARDLYRVVRGRGAEEDDFEGGPGTIAAVWSRADAEADAGALEGATPTPNVAAAKKTPKKTPAKKAPAKKSSAKKRAAKKASSKKSAAKKPPTKTAASSKRAAPKKAAAAKKKPAFADPPKAGRVTSIAKKKAGAGAGKKGRAASARGKSRSKTRR